MPVFGAARVIISVTGIGYAPRRTTQETFQFHLLNPTPYRARLLSAGSPLLLIRLTQQATICSVEGCPDRRFRKRCGSFKASSPPRKPANTPGGLPLARWLHLPPMPISASVRTGESTKVAVRRLPSPNLPDGRDGSSQDPDPDKTARRVNWLLKWALRSQ